MVADDRIFTSPAPVGGRMAMSDASETARAYYRSLDDRDYDRLRGLLAPDVVHRRPDRTFEGRGTLVSFMRDGRPSTDTTHEVRALYVEHEPVDGRDDGGPEADGRDGSGRGERDETEVAVRGRLLDADDDPLFAFVDVFTVAAGRIGTIETFTR